MSTAATDSQDRSQPAAPAAADVETRRDNTVLKLLLGDEHHCPWSIEELARTIGDRNDTVDAVSSLQAAGLLHRVGDFVFTTLAARRADELAEGAI